MMRALGSMLALAIACSLCACEKPDVVDGVPRLKSTWTDNGEASGNAGVRALISVRLRDRSKLDAFVRDLYDPQSPSFRKYLSAKEATERFAPGEDDLQAVRSWLSAHKIEIARVAHNRLFVEARGDASAFNEAFATRLHAYKHRDGYEAFGTPDGLTLPSDVPALSAVASLDTLVSDNVEEQTGEAKSIQTPEGVGFKPVEVAQAYGLEELASRGERGKGAKIGVVTGGGVNLADIGTFWKSFGVHRPAPIVKDLMEAPPKLGFEATFDVEWAGVLAPEADVVVFQGSDPRTTSLLFSFNAAVAGGEVDVVTDSFAHREETEPMPTRELYDIAAELGAAIGTTVVSATGDSAKPDVPASCPFVTGVGGTRLKMEAGVVVKEEAWERSGAGPASFPAPAWQKRVNAGSAQRAIADVALNAGAAYVSRYKGNWRPTGGTSVSSPVFAAMIAVINGARKASGRPTVGFLNPALYESESVQKSFRDVTTGGTTEFAARAGWDMPSGWGSPHGAKLADALP